MMMTAVMRVFARCVTLRMLVLTEFDRVGVMRTATDDGVPEHSEGRHQRYELEPHCSTWVAG